MTKWSLGYQILKIYFSIAFRFFYQRVDSIGKKNIPRKKPIIFAPNHQNALMDPLAIIFSSGKQPVFLTRSDIFNKPLLLKIFTFLKMLPVYRIRDGADSLKKNEYIFEKSVEVLEANASVGLFPEATHTDKRRLRPLKKAVPRIAFMAEEQNDFKLDLQIIPVGIYYDDYVHSNSNLFINYGEAFPITKYKDLYQKNPQKAYADFRIDIADKIKKLIIHISDLEHYSIYEQIRLFYRSTMKKRLGIKGAHLKNSFLADKKTIEIAEKVFLEGDQNIEIFANQYRRLNTGLRKKGFDILDFEAICPGKTILSSILLLLGLPIFIFGALNGGLYYFLSLKLINKIKDKQFHTSFKYGLAAVLYPILFIIHSLIFWAVSGNGTAAVYYFFATMISVMLANKYRYLFKATIKQWKILFLKWFNSKDYQSIVKSRQALIDYLDGLFFPA